MEEAALPAACGRQELCIRHATVLILVNQAAEPITSEDLVELRRSVPGEGPWWSGLTEGAMWRWSL